MQRTMTLQVMVTVPAITPESEVESAFNAALDEPPCDWGEWVVGAVSIVSVAKHQKRKGPNPSA